MQEREGFVEGDAGNYYGRVAVWKDGRLFMMGVENWNGWHGYPISEALYDAFVKEYSK